MKRGDIRLANFNPSRGTEAGKIRPCLVLQSDLLNEAGHPSTTVIPMTSRLTDDAAPLRCCIRRREGLEHDSDAMIDQLRTIDNRRFVGDLLVRVTTKELAIIEEYVRIVLGLP